MSTVDLKVIKRIRFGDLADTVKLGVQGGACPRAKAINQIRREIQNDFQFHMRVAAMFYSVACRHQGARKSNICRR